MHNCLFVNEDKLQNALMLLLTAVFFINDNHRKENHNDFHSEFENRIANL